MMWKQCYGWRKECKMSSKVRKISIVIALVLALVIVLSALYLVFFIQRTEYMTIYEFYHSPEYHHWEQYGEFPEDVRFNVKDTVLSSSSIKFPNLIFGPNQTDISIDLFNATFLTFVMFDSMLNESTVFLGDVTDEFQPGTEVKFQLESREFSVPWYFGTSAPNRTLVEPVYAALLLAVYHSLLGSKKYFIAEVEGELINNSTQLMVRVKTVGDYYPMPFTWANVTVSMCPELSCEELDAQPRIELYDKDGSFLGILNSSSPNSSISDNTEAGQYLLVSYDPQYSSHFLLFEAVFEENGTRFPWAHITVP